MNKQAPQGHFHFDQSKSGQFRDYIMYDVFADIGDVHYKGLFGGYGFYLEDTIFAAYIDDGKGAVGLYLKADKEFGEEIESRGGSQFIYKGHKSRGPTAMPYWYIPDEFLEDRELMVDWAYRSFEISNKSKK